MSGHIADHIRVVLFDHDDTLVGTIEPKWRQHKHIAKKFYNLDLTDDEIRAHWGKPFMELVRLVYNTDDAEQALAYTLATHKKFPKVLFPATKATLKHLKEKGKLVGIITATVRRSIEQDLDHHNIPRKYIDYIQTSEDTNFHKPDPRVFEPTLQWLSGKGVAANEVIYIGDGLHDMKAALGAGFNFLGVETGSLLPNNLKPPAQAASPLLPSS